MAVGGHEHVLMPDDLEHLAGGPFTNSGQTYAELAATWGFEMHPDLADYMHLNGGEMADNLMEGAPDFMLYGGVQGNVDIYTEKCGLCAVLGVEHGEQSLALLEVHMGRK